MTRLSAFRDPAATKKVQVVVRGEHFQYKAVENPVSVHDIHATILHLLGMDHKRLTYLYNGRRFRLTDVAGNVIHNIIA